MKLVFIQLQLFRSVVSLKGFLLIIPSLLFLIFEAWALLYVPIANEDYSIHSLQYWSIVIPFFLMFIVIGGTAAYIGYTMIVTPEPHKISYDEAYEIALDEKNTTK